jgi:Kinesin motor domain.
MAKLHLVDLAGSEQLFSLSDNYLLRNEARKINLSLHYLEQVRVGGGGGEREGGGGGGGEEEREEEEGKRGGGKGGK